MKVKQKCGFFESLKTRISIDVYEPARLIILCVIPFVLYGIFALAYFVFEWGILSFLPIGILSVIYIGLGLFWGLDDFYDLSIDISTYKLLKNDECLGEKAAKKFLNVHTWLLNIGIILLLSAGIALETAALYCYYKYQANFIWVSICVCIAPAMINIAVFFIDVSRAWQKEKEDIYNDRSYVPEYCKKCHCLYCFSSEPNRVEEKIEGGSYTDVVDRTVGSIKYDGGSLDITTRVCEDVSYKYLKKYEYYDCGNCGNTAIRIREKKLS